MLLKKKMMIGTTLLAAIPVIIASLAIQTTATNASHEALQEASKERLIAVRDATKEGITGYLTTIRNQVLTFSNNRMVVEAMSYFKDSFKNYQEQASATDTEELRSQLGSYYSGDFSSQYQQRNPGGRANAPQWLAQLDAETGDIIYSVFKELDYTTSLKNTPFANTSKGI